MTKMTEGINTKPRDTQRQQTHDDAMFGKATNLINSLLGPRRDIEYIINSCLFSTIRGV